MAILKQSNVDNESISACDSQSTSYDLCKTAPCNGEAQSSFSMAFGDNSLRLMQESYRSESSSDGLLVGNKQNGSQLAAISGGMFQSHGDDAQTSSKQPHCDLVHMSSGVSIPVCTSKSTPCTVCENAIYIC